MYTINQGREEVADRGILRKRRREEDKMNSPERGEVSRKRRREEEPMNSPENGVALRKRHREDDAMNSSETGEVQRKRRRVEEAMNSPETGVVQRKRRREEDAMNCPETGVVQRKRRREEDAMNCPETGVVQRKRRREEDAMNCPETGVVQRKRRREEDAMNCPETGVVLRKKRRVEDAMNSSETGEIQRKRRRVEEAINSPERDEVLRQRSREELAEPTDESRKEIRFFKEPADESRKKTGFFEEPAKKSRKKTRFFEEPANKSRKKISFFEEPAKESRKNSSETGEIQRKRRRVQEAINSPERDMVLRQRSREELAEPTDKSRKEIRFFEEPADESRKKTGFFEEPAKKSRKKTRFFEEPANKSRKKISFFEEPAKESRKNSSETGEIQRKRRRVQEAINSPERDMVLRQRSREELAEPTDKSRKEIRFFEEPAYESRKKTGFFEEPAKKIRKKTGFFEEPADESRKKIQFFEEPAKKSRKKTGFFEEPANKSRKKISFFEEPAKESRKKTGLFEEPANKSRKKISFLEEPAVESRKKTPFFEEADNESRKKTPKIDEAGVCGVTSVHKAEHEWAPTEQAPDSLGPESFVYHKILGEGGFGKVVLATHRDSSMLVAIKIVRKDFVALHPPSILTERQVMEMVGSNRFFTHTYATFQTEDHLFYVMEFLRGGDLWKWLCTKGTLDLNTLRLLAAELLCGLQYLHSRGVAHRDLKLDNVLVECAGHVKYADFGEAATNLFGSRTETTKAGTEMYRAPEIIWGEPHDKTVDYFSLGIMLFEMAFRYHPFNKANMNYSICYDSPDYPENADHDLVAFLNKLLCKDQQERKEAIANIRDDRFFQGINWEEVKAGETQPPFFVRRVGHRQMTKQTIELEELTGEDTAIPLDLQYHFDGFSFVSNTWRVMQRLNRGQNIRV